MAETIEIKVEGIEELKRKLSPEVFDKAIRLGMSGGAWNMVRWAQDNRMSGPRPTFLGMGTGNLKASVIASPVEKVGDNYQVKIGTNKVYAKIHEYGGIIKAKNAPYLIFKVHQSTRIMSKRGGFLKNPQAEYGFVRVKQVTMPARPYLHPAIQDPGNMDYLKSNIIRTLEEAIK